MQNDNIADISREELMKFLSEHRKEIVSSMWTIRRDITFIYCKVVPGKSTVEIWGMTFAREKIRLIGFRLPALHVKYSTVRQLLTERMYDEQIKRLQYFTSTFKDRKDLFLERMPEGSKFYVLVGKCGALTYPGSREVRTFSNKMTVDNIRILINSDKTGTYPDNNYRVVLVKDLGKESSTDNVWDYSMHFEETTDGWYTEKRA